MEDDELYKNRFLFFPNFTEDLHCFLTMPVLSFLPESLYEVYYIIGGYEVNHVSEPARNLCKIYKTLIRNIEMIGLDGKDSWKTLIWIPMAIFTLVMTFAF